MTRAILAGHKTQTRRIVTDQSLITTHADGSPAKAQPRMIYGGIISTSTDKKEEGKHVWYDNIPCPKIRVSIRCPYGKPGDQLWVRETWRTWRSLDHCKPSGIAEGAAIAYEADGRTNINNHEAGPLIDAGRIRQAIFLRRWMARIHLLIEEIRVERLQDISPDDCRAEGQPHQNTDLGVRYGYGALWNQIHGPGSWDENPWVWVITFKPL
jgi:hypothetical protein